MNTSQPAGADIVALDAVALSAAIQRRTVSCVEVLDAFLAQIDRFNPRVNAIVALQDRDGLRRIASERDGQLAAGRLQIVGPAQCDFEVLQLGHAYAQASGCSAVASPLLAAAGAQ